MTIKHILAAVALSTCLITGAMCAERAPIIVVFGATAADTLAGAYGGSLVPDLRAEGYDVRSLDLPCHGPGEAGLECWGKTVAAGEGEVMFNEFCGKVADLLSEIGTDRAQFVGVSRGAYVAAYCGGREPRVLDIGMIAPVTDLAQLSEFSDVPIPNSLNSASLARAVKGKHIYARIGKDDTRVGTAAARSFALAAGAQLDVVDAEGHAAPDPEGKMLAWLISGWGS